MITYFFKEKFSTSKFSEYCLLGLLLCFFPSNVLGQKFEVPTDRKVIDKNGFKEIVYTTKKTPYPRTSGIYHWYKTRGLHTSQSNYAGELLDGDYLKYYPDNQLAEKGVFKKGLKVSVWNTWHQNGILHTRSLWKNGRLSGRYVKWDSLGNTLEAGRYSRGFKNGKWIFYAKGDTIQYKKGKAVIRDTANDSLQQRTSFFKRVFGKKEDKKEMENNKKKGQREKSQLTEPNKEGLFKRLFKKKDKKNGDENA